MPFFRTGTVLLATWLLGCGLAAQGGQPAGEAERELINEAEDTAAEAEAARRRDRGSKWTFTVYSGMQWDDNIILEGDGVDVEDTEQTDWKSIHVLQADYYLVIAIDLQFAGRFAQPQ